MSRTIGNAGLELIKQFEGCRLTAYQDSVGVWTIGYGHTANVVKGMKITQSQADTYLKADCQKFANYVDSASYVPITKSLNDNQRDALISFAFNCGQGNLKKLCAGRTAYQISAKFASYNKAGGKVLAGLTRRRTAEKNLFNTPVKITEIPESEDYNMQTIKKGSKGKSVKIWQIILGFTGDDVDGSFGSGTESKTISWQKSHGLSSDGSVGPETWKAGFNSL